jgi:hypothetical protein
MQFIINEQKFEQCSNTQHHKKFEPQFDNKICTKFVKSNLKILGSRDVTGTSHRWDLQWEVFKLFILLLGPIVCSPNFYIKEL